MNLIQILSAAFLLSKRKI